MTTFTREEVAKKKWIVIDSVVYDISKFIDLHPGGSTVLEPYIGTGKDATEV